MHKLIYVKAASGRSLMPTTRKGHVSRLLNSGKARIIRHNPFTIQLKYETEGHFQILYGGRDDAYISVMDEKGRIILNAHLATRNWEIVKLMMDRAMHRRASRAGERKVRKRLGKRYGTTFKGMMERILPGCGKPIRLRDMINSEARFMNRRRPAGWLTPTAEQLRRTYINFAAIIDDLVPVAEWSFQVTKYCFQILENGRIYGSDFCNGRMKDYKDIREYISARQDGKCLLCGKPIEHLHHVVPKSRGGSNTPDNIVGLCRECHMGLHTDKIQKKLKGKLKKYDALSVMNTAAPFILRSLQDKYGEGHIHVVSSAEAAFLRIESLPYGACIAAAGAGIEDITENDSPVYELMQFRRHDRQIVKYQQERAYKLNGETIAKNRKPRSEQPKKYPGLSVWFEERVFEAGYDQAYRELSTLTVEKSKRAYNNLHRDLPGMIFIYKGEEYVLKGQHSYGSEYQAVGFGSKDFPAKECTILKKNTGIVWLTENAEPSAKAEHLKRLQHSPKYKTLK